MSWFPTFLNAPAAMISAAILAPVLLALYFLKLHRQETLISSTLLWKKSIEDLQANTPFQKLRRNLLLILQMLALMLVLLAIAQPVLNLPASSGKALIILIDRSASMQATDTPSQTRLQLAKIRARQLLDHLDRNALAAVIAFDDQALVVQSFTSDVSALRQAVDSIKPTDRPSRLRPAYLLAQAQSASLTNSSQPDSLPQIRLLSDGKILDADDLPPLPNVSFEPIGQPGTANTAIVALSARRNYQNPAQVQIFARLANFSAQAVDCDVQLSIAPIDPAESGTVRWIKTRLASVTLAPQHAPPDQPESDLPPNQRARDSVEFTIDLPTAALIRLELLHRDDALPTDDGAQLVIPSPHLMRVALVTPGNFFLEKAVKALSLQSLALLTPEQYETAMAGRQVDSFDVIIFDRYSPPVLAATNQPLLPTTGNFLWFGAVPAGIGLHWAQTDNRPITVENVGVLDWKRDHPILRSLQLSHLFFASAWQLQSDQQSDVLIDGLKGPLLLLHHQGDQTHIVAGFDLLQSNWPLHISFPIFIQNALSYLAMGASMDIHQSYAAGTPLVIPRTALSSASLAAGDTIRLAGPDQNRTITIPATGDFALPALDRVGIYTLDPPIDRFEHLAVNLLNANESDLTPAQLPPGNIGQTISALARPNRVDLWWWIIALAVLPLLLIEWWVYMRRVHL